MQKVIIQSSEWHLNSVQQIGPGATHQILQIKEKKLASTHSLSIICLLCWKEQGFSEKSQWSCDEEKNNHWSITDVGKETQSNISYFISVFSL